MLLVWILPALLPYLSESVAQPQNAGGLDSLPTDPGQAWGVIVATICLALSPVAVGLLKARKGEQSNTKAPALGPIDTAMPRIDAQGALLDRYVSKVDEIAKIAESKYADLERKTDAKAAEQEKRLYEQQRQIIELQGKLARCEAKVELLDRENHEIREENSLLRGQLMGRDR